MKILKSYANKYYEKFDFCDYFYFSKLKLGQKESGCLDLSRAGELGYNEAYEAIKKYCQ